MHFIVALLLTCTSAFGASKYTQSMYRRGLHEPGVLITSAPLYVLITLGNPLTGSVRQAAIPGTFLLGAIAAEYHLGYDADGNREQLQIALAQPGRAFSFRDPKALNNVEPRYTREILRKVKGVLAPKSRAELFAAAQANKS